MYKNSYNACETMRQRFEMLVSSLNGGQLPPESQDLLSLLHQIEVQRIELELQVDELRLANRGLDASRREAVERQEFVPLAVVSVNGKGIIQNCNEAAIAMFAATRSSIVGTGFSQWVIDEDHGTYFAYRASLASHSAAPFCEIRIWGPERRVRNVRLYARALPTTAEKPLWQYALVNFTGARQTKERLRQNENLYRSLAANLPNGAAFIVDHELTYILAEGQALKTAGMTSSDLEGKTLFEALPLELAALFEPHYRSALGGAPAKFEHNSHGRDYMTHVSPLRENDGNVYAAMAVSYDISERKRAEEALKESEERFRTMADGLPLIVWVHDAEGNQQFVNQTFLEFFGTTHDEMRGDRWQLLMHPDDAQGYADEFLACVREQRFFHRQVRVQNADGEWRWIESWARPRFTFSGKYLGHVGTSADVTERKQVEAALAAKTELLEGIYYLMPVLLVLWDPHLERFILNRRAEEVLGYSSVEANGGDFMRRIYPDDAYREEVVTFMQSLDTGWQEWICTTRDGERVPIEWANIRLSDDTRIGIGVDLRERKKAEASLRESHQELSEYTYALTHNIKAPFRAVQNYANFLLEDLADSLEGEPRQFLDGIQKAIGLAHQQFVDLEALYKVKDHPLEFETLEMRELLAEIATLHGGRPDCELVIEAEWPRFWGEYFLLRQILMALVNNGFKYNRSDIKRVEVNWQRPSDNRFEIIVRDNGIGIDPEYHEHIFHIFKRLHTEEEYEGTGIGLAIVKRAMQKIGGELKIESAVGQGSTFVISLPSGMVESADEHHH